MTSQYVSLDLSNTATAMQSMKQCSSVVSTVVSTDYITRVAMDLVPNEIKESYINPVFNGINEAITSVVGNVYGCFYNRED